MTFSTHLRAHVSRGRSRFDDTGPRLRTAHAWTDRRSVLLGSRSDEGRRARDARQDCRHRFQGSRVRGPLRTASPKDVRAILDKNGLTAPASHVDWATVDTKLPETLETAKILGHAVSDRALRRRGGAQAAGHLEEGRRSLQPRRCRNAEGGHPVRVPSARLRVRSLPSAGRQTAVRLPTREHRSEAGEDGTRHLLDGGRRAGSSRVLQEVPGPFPARARQGLVEEWRTGKGLCRCAWRREHVQRRDGQRWHRARSTGSGSSPRPTTPASSTTSSSTTIRSRRSTILRPAISS